MHLVSSEADIRRLVLNVLICFQFSVRLEDEAHNRWEQRNIFARYITAVGNCISAHTDIICYCFAVFVHAYTAGLLTLPLPALVHFFANVVAPLFAITHFLNLNNFCMNSTVSKCYREKGSTLFFTKLVKFLKSI